MLESWSNIIKQKTRAAGQSVLKAQRLLSNSWIGWEAHTELKESVWELSLDGSSMFSKGLGYAIAYPLTSCC
ncbi:MAG: hypothetical protein F6K56_18610 [Moorea sp. SIO3G5]|nr:hypothetical protein [Moorena sp. SIO3G5]